MKIFTQLSDPYDTFACVYDQKAHGYITSEFFRLARTAVSRVPSSRAIFDLGCGTGTLTAMLAREGRAVIGIDRSDVMLASARLRCRRFGSRVRFLKRNLSN